jgi:photosystem II stability/assembly factor-like uncharacterized protein
MEDLESPGLYVRGVDESTWQAVVDGPRGQVWSIAHLPDDGATFLAGTLPPALFRTEDNGREWGELTTFQATAGRADWTFFDGPRTAHVRSLSVSAASRGVVAAAIEVGGIAVSMDRGVTWKDRTGPLHRDCHSVHLSRLEPGRLFATCAAGLFVSEDCGVTWETTPRVAGYVVPIVSTLDESVVLTTSVDGDGVVHRSDDGGRTFRAVGEGLPPPDHGAATLLIDPFDAEEMVYVGSTPHGGAVHTSDDGGATWRKVRAVPSTPRRITTAVPPL